MPMATSISYTSLSTDCLDLNVLGNRIFYYGSKDWADNSIRYLLHLLKDDSHWNLPHNFHMKRTVAQLIIGRLFEKNFCWHGRVASGHYHRWLKRKSWSAIV